MQLGPFYLGQVPRDPLSFLVRDVASNDVIDLTGYTEAQIVVLDPDGASVDTTGGTCEIANATGGEVRYVFGSTSLFSVVGDYQLQLILTGPGSQDLTVPASFEVYRNLASLVGG